MTKFKSPHDEIQVNPFPFPVPYSSSSPFKQDKDEIQFSQVIILSSRLSFFEVNVNSIKSTRLDSTRLDSVN